MSTALKIAAGLSVIGLGVVAYDSLIGVATIEVVHHEEREQEVQPTSKHAPNGQPYYGPAF